MRKDILTIGALTILIVSGLSAAAPAPAESAGQASDAWQFEIMPYLWAPGLQGDITAGNSIDGAIDAIFSDILKSLDFALMGSFQIRRGRVGLLFDGIYTKFSKSGVTSGTLIDEVRAEVTTQIYSLAASYRILDGRIPLDIVGGIRVMPIRAALEVTSGILEGSQASGSNTPLAGFVGARVAFPLMSRLTLDAYADVGAGGSTLTWQTLAGLSYRLSGTFSAKLGFRFLGIDTEKPEIQTKIVGGGFYAGVGICF